MMSKIRRMSQGVIAVNPGLRRWKGGKGGGQVGGVFKVILIYFGV